MSKGVCFICRNTGIAHFVLSWSEYPNALGGSYCCCSNGRQAKKEAEE